MQKMRMVVLRCIEPAQLYPDVVRVLLQKGQTRMVMITTAIHQLHGQY